MLESRTVNGIEVHDIYESAFHELVTEMYPADVLHKYERKAGEYAAVQTSAYHGTSTLTTITSRLTTENLGDNVEEIAQRINELKEGTLRLMSRDIAKSGAEYEIWHIVADPVTEEEQETDTELEFARRAFEQARNLIGEEWCEYYRGWTHGLLDMLEETNYTIGYHIAWSDDYSNWYLQRVELIKYQSEEPWTPEVIDSETC